MSSTQVWPAPSDPVRKSSTMSNTTQSCTTNTPGALMGNSSGFFLDSAQPWNSRRWSPPRNSSIEPVEVAQDAMPSETHRQRSNSPMSVDARSEGSAENNHHENKMRKEHRPRKGHRKSRRGCYNCKRRKIKCQEILPACDNCLRKHLDCVYPDTAKPVHDGSIEEHSLPAPILHPQATPLVFSMLDMRLFHHFMLHASPSIPTETDIQWIYSVPSLAHHNEYLMHAILGLAASHLELITGEDLKAVALNHRYMAIKGSNEVLSKQQRSASDGDALLGACYAVTFQTSYLSDGMTEFMSMTRGCTTLFQQLKAEGLPFVFDMAQDIHWKQIKENVGQIPTINPKLIAGMAEALAPLGALCMDSTTKEFYEAMAVIPNALSWCSYEGYVKFTCIYGVMHRMDAVEFQQFNDPENETSQILLCHFLSIQVILAPILDRERSGRTMKSPIRGHMNWISDTYTKISQSKRHLIEWPKYIVDCVRLELADYEHPITDPEIVSSFVPILRKREGLSKGLV